MLPIAQCRQVVIALTTAGRQAMKQGRHKLVGEIRAAAVQLCDIWVRVGCLPADAQHASVGSEEEGLNVWMSVNSKHFIFWSHQSKGWVLSTTPCFGNQDDKMTAWMYGESKFMTGQFPDLTRLFVPGGQNVSVVKALKVASDDPLFVALPYEDYLVQENKRLSEQLGEPSAGCVVTFAAYDVVDLGACKDRIL